MPKTVTLKTAVLGMLTAALVSAPSLANAEDALKGMIISRDGSTIVVRGSAGETPVVVTESTKIRGTSGGLGVRGETHPASDLIRGLAVEVAGSTEGDHFNATSVTFKNSDLKTAKQIAAGLYSAEGRIDENSARLDNVGLLQAAGRTKVFFPVGSAVISEKGKQDLQAIATQAKDLKGAYRLAVVGRADPSGNAAANERLSEARAAAVTTYLMRSAGISPANFIPTAALGSAEVAQDPDPPKNAQEARRVTVTIAVSKTAR